MENTICIRIRGGLGNQMFQYAFAYLLCRKFPNPKIILDVREYNNYYWPFELDKLSLKQKFEISRDKQKYDRKIRLYHFYQGIYRKVHKKSPTSFKKNWIKKGYVFCGQYCEMPKINFTNDVYLYGYFQNVNLFNDIKKDLLDIFSLKEKTPKTKKYVPLIKEKSISVNIRFFEQIELDKHETYSYNERKYYLSLIEEIIERRKEKVQLVISSNDIEKIKKENWLKEYDDVLFVEDCSASEQLEIMKHCRDFVLANSTFSWWIGYLGSEGKDSIVLAPKIWFQNQKIEDTKIQFKKMELR